ncbi:MAG: hypothetical protein IPL79_03130 [Myxococcales bacterium]|nr:hypothetical protein [Myxococcales bacterium]
MATRPAQDRSTWASAMVGIWLAACVSAACLAGNVLPTARASLRAVAASSDLTPTHLTAALRPWGAFAAVVAGLLLLALASGSVLYALLARWERAQLPPLPDNAPPAPEPSWQPALSASGGAIAVAVVAMLLAGVIMASPFAPRPPWWGWGLPLAVIWGLAITRAVVATAAMLARRGDHQARHLAARRDQHRRQAQRNPRHPPSDLHDRIVRIVLAPDAIVLHTSTAQRQLPPHELDAALALARRDGAVIERAP